MKDSASMAKTKARIFHPVLQGASETGAEIFGALLPEQFYIPAHESHKRWTGERRLMLAVLQEAVQAYLKYSLSTTHRGRRLFEETRTWFWSLEQPYLFSFESLCAYLQLDPDYIRRGLEARIQQQRSCSSLTRGTYQRAPVSSHRGRLARAA